MRLRERNEVGLKPADVTITFDYLDRGTEFTTCIGRTINREEDGFHHCTQGEWQSKLCLPGMSLISRADG